MEYLEVLNANGSKTGVKKLKSDVHKQGDWHRSVHVWLMNSQNQILIQKRAPGKAAFPNHWDISSAGHVVAGEDSLTSALRETQEELGLTLNPQDLIYLFTNTRSLVLNSGSLIENEIQDVFLVKKDVKLSDLRLQKKEVSEIKFVGLKKLKQMIDRKTETFVPHPDEYRKLFAYLENIKLKKTKSYEK